MFRKIFFGVFVTLIIVAGLTGFFYLKKIETPVSNAIKAIPVDAEFIIRCNSADIVWKKIAQSNIIWQDLISENIFSEMNKNGILLDSLIQVSPDMTSLANGNPLFISAHESQKNQVNFLFTYSLPDITKREVIETFIKNTFKNSKINAQNYDGTSIKTITTGNDKKINCAFLDGIFVASIDLNLVQNAIKQFKNKTSLLDDKNFSKVFRTAGNNVDATIFINYEKMSSSLNYYLANENENILAHFANWTAIDLSIKPNELMMDGFSVATPSQNKILNLFVNQKPQNIELTKIIPANTAFLFFMGISNTKLFCNNYFKSIKNSTSSDSLKNYFSWVENEAAFVITEPQNLDWKDNAYAVFHSNDIENAKKMLQILTDSLRVDSTSKSDSENYQGVGIYQLPIPNLIPKIFGSIFAPIKNNYYSIIADYVVFANSSKDLKNFIQTYQSGQTLQNDAYYKEFSSDHLDKESNIYFYANVARSTSILESFLKNNFSKEIENKLPLFQKMEAIGLQYSFDNGLFYTNAYFKRNPIYKKESNSIWEVNLDTTVSSQPYFVTNYITGEKEVFVQDNANKVYLISNTGKVRWQKQIAGKIMGGISQIDCYKNNKLQLLFNTDSAIYLIDRNGNFVQNFPIKLPTKATNPLVVFDYEQNKDYRILVACADKHIYNYQADGSLVDGWKFNQAENNILTPIKHCIVNDKDYLVAIDSSGKTYFLDRQGRTRFQLKNTLTTNVKDFFLDPRKDLEHSKIITSDSLGNILRLSFNDQSESIKIADFNGNPTFDYKDMDDTKIRKYIFLTADKLSVYNQDKSLSFSYSFKTKTSGEPLFFMYPDKSGRIGIVCKNANELYLIDNNGRLCNEFPLYGSTPFSISDMNNDGQLYLVTGSMDKKIILYQLP